MTIRVTHLLSCPIRSSANIQNDFIQSDIYTYITIHVLIYSHSLSAEIQVVSHKITNLFLRPLSSKNEYPKSIAKSRMENTPALHLESSPTPLNPFAMKSENPNQSLHHQPTGTQ